MSSTVKTCESAKGVIWYDADICPQFDPNLFDPNWLRDQGYLQGGSDGRNQAHFLRVNGQDMVLRHYYRGGLVGKVNTDLFLRVPAERSRAMQEMRLLQWMRDQGLPVPRPLAAQYAVAGLWYRADLIMAKLPDTQTLADRLRAMALPQHLWVRIGETVQHMHRLGVDHSDLNCRNILIDGTDQIWLIDFDKCRRRPDGTWTERNLARLKRSLEKEATHYPGLHWSAAAWSSLITGYERRANGPGDVDPP